MSEGPDSLVLRYLRSIDERLDQLSKDMAHGFAVLTGHMVGLTGRVAGLEARMDAMEGWSADTTARLDRIEKRLGLIEA